MLRDLVYSRLKAVHCRTSRTKTARASEVSPVKIAVRFTTTTLKSRPKTAAKVSAVKGEVCVKTATHATTARLKSGTEHGEPPKMREVRCESCERVREAKPTQNGIRELPRSEEEPAQKTACRVKRCEDERLGAEKEGS